MFHDYDPYQDLQRCKEEINRQRASINQLIQAHNQIDAILLDLTDQHRQLVNLIRTNKHQITMLHAEINLLKSK